MTVTVEVVDSVAAFRDLMLLLASGTQIESVPVRTKRQEGEAPPFYLVSEGGSIRHRTGPAYAPARVNLSRWDLDKDAAAEGYLIASELLHRYGPIVLTSGVGIFKVFDETGLQEPFEDPDTAWWRAFGVFDLVLVDRIVD